MVVTAASVVAGAAVIETCALFCEFQMFLWGNMPAGSLVLSVLFVIDHPIAQVLIAEAESSTLLLRSGAGNHVSKVVFVLNHLDTCR
ncbi:unnamed protein product [Urochloa humidicola]